MNSAGMARSTLEASLMIFTETLMESPAATITKNRTSVKAIITYAAIAQYCCVASLLSR